MATKQISFIPSVLADSLLSQVEFMNKQLSRLQSFVADHGETWADVLTYNARGTDHKKQERLDEIRKWMDSSKAPRYVRGTMEKQAVADLGSANLQYWADLAVMMSIRQTNTMGSPCLNLAEDVDASGEKWRVADSWIARQKEELTVVLPDSIVADMQEFKDLGKSLADFERRGYNVEALAGYLVLCSNNPSMFDNDIEPEGWCECYNQQNDNRVKVAEN